VIAQACFQDWNSSNGYPVTARSTDILVIGAGPVGCVTALAFARKGASVLLLEGNPRSSHRLAGECLHPTGVHILESLGLGDLVGSGYQGHGFAVFPADGSEPILLQYPDGACGFTCEHVALVSALRAAASRHNFIDFVSSGHALAIAGQRVTFADENGQRRTVQADLIVGADGRSSLARASLGLKDQRHYVSSMAGVLLDDVQLLHEGFGQVLLGGPGPILACRIGPSKVRLFLDVPPGRMEKDQESLHAAFEPALPEIWRGAFRQALADRPIAWASNQRRSRAHYGRPGLALVGDAVGHYHPLTAVGMTLGFMDGYYLAECKSFSDYRRVRTAQSGAAELLANSLYRVFTQNDVASLALRHAIFQTWRHCPVESRRTMRLLSGEETDTAQFHRAFVRVLVQAAQQVLQDSLLSMDWKQTARALKGFAWWLGWLATGEAEMSGEDHTDSVAPEKSKLKKVLGSLQRLQGTKWL